MLIELTDLWHGGLFFIKTIRKLDNYGVRLTSSVTSYSDSSLVQIKMMKRSESPLRGFDKHNPGCLTFNNMVGMCHELEDVA